MSTYREVMALAKGMADKTKTTDRREDGLRLAQMLGKAEIRQRLASEASAASEAARQHALSEMWRTVVRYATLATQSIGTTGKGKTKMNKQDIDVFNSIIMHCEESSNSSDPKQRIFRLSRSEVKIVMQLCISLLSKEEALKIAEGTLLNLLAYIAGSRGFVAYLKSENELQIIMEEVETRISDDDPNRRAAAAKIFQNLCQTAESLGIQLHPLVPASVKMVATWCAESYRETGRAVDVGRRPVAEMNPLMSGLAAMVRSCPEQAIAPLTRNGRAILKFAKARYRQVADPTDRNVLNEFFLCYLLVSQVAGLFQGLMPGDLGNLGEASVKRRLLDDLLEIITTKNPTRAWSSKKSDDDLLRWPLDELEQTQLELTARLLACAQRLFLVEAELKELENPEHTLMAMIDSIPRRDDLVPLDKEDHVQSCSSEVVSTSPFVKLVLKPLHDFAPPSQSIVGGTATPAARHHQGAATATMSQLTQSGSPSPSQAAQSFQQSQRETQGQLSESALPLLENMATNNVNNGHKTDVDTAKRLLQTLAACAEIFPTGTCWTSQSQSCWRDLPGDSSDDTNFEVRRALACTPDDLAAVITTVANILEAHGDISGDADVQQWTLRCLQRLTEATSALSLVEKNKSSFDSVRDAWRRVWTILFRSDFRYIVCTRACTAESIGDLVLRLLTLMVRHCCVDPEVRWSNDIHEKQATFLYQRQTDLWNLPIFVHLKEPSVVSKFDLIVSLLFSVGLAEGADSVALGLQLEGFETIQLPNRGRRYRLVNACLHCLTHHENHEMIGIAAACAAALAHGNRTPWSMDLNKVLTEPSMTRTRQTCRTAMVSSCATNLYEALWANPPAIQHETSPGAVMGLDPVFICLCKLYLGIEAADNTLQSADILAKSQSIPLLDDLHPRLEQAFQYCNVEGAEEEVTVSGNAQVSLSLLRMKTELTVALSCGQDQVAVELEQVAEQLSLLLETISSKFGCLSQLLAGTLADVLKIMTFLIQVTSFPHLELPASITRGANLLYEELEKALDSYTGVETPPQLTSSQKNLDLEADLDADSDSGMEDSGPGKTPKRARQPPRREVKRRRTEASSSSVLLDPKSALVAAKLFLLFKPSVSSAKFVAETLLGIDLERHSQIPDPVGTFDALSGATMSELCQTFAGLREEETRDSVASLVPMLIRMTRLNAGPESQFHLFGFNLCADVVVKCESIRGVELSAAEAGDLLSVWKDLNPIERKSLSLRPELRATSLRTTALAFVNGRAGLHSKWEKNYPGTILSGIIDVSQEVRRQASAAVAASLQVMSPQEKVIQSMFRNLPPISVEHGEYRRWYKSIARGLDLSWHQVWEDAQHSVEAGVLYCWACIGGRTTHSREQRRILFRLIQAAHCRPDLEASCFQALDYLAYVAGFGQAESMVAECVNDLMKMWQDERSRDSFLELPLIMTAPQTLRFLICSGFLHTWADTPTMTGVMAGLRSHASMRFVRRNSQNLLPLHLATQTQPTSNSTHLRDLCSVHSDTDDFNDAILGKLVKKYLQGIIAYCATLQCGSATDQETAVAIQHRAESLLSEDEVQRLGAQRAASTLRGILDNIGSSDIPLEQFDESIVRFSQELQDVANRFGTAGKFDPFSRTGSSLAECLLYATSWLHKTMAEWTMQQRFQVIALLTNTTIDCIRRGEHGKLQLGFFVHVFSELLSDRNLSSIHSRTLTILKNALKELLIRCASALPSNVVTQIKTELAALLSSLMHLHELSQQRVVMAVREDRTAREKWQRLSMGVLAAPSCDEDQDIWRCDENNDTATEGVASYESILNDANGPVSKDIVSVLIGTYEAIELIVGKADTVPLEVRYFLGASPPYVTPEADRVLLSEIDQKYCAQKLVEDFLSVSNADIHAEHALLRRVLDQASRVESMSSQCVLLGTTESSFSPEQKQFLAELTMLYESLYSSGEAGRTGLTGNDVDSLMKYLSEFCGNYPPAIRVQASRCIGELGRVRPAGSGFESHISTDWIGRSISAGKLESALQARCIEVLTACLKIQPISKAMVAMETLKALLGSQEGVECRDLVEKGTSTLLEPFYSSPRDKRRQSALRLNKTEIKTVNRAFPTNGDTWTDWCWDESFWASATQTDFEQWICTLVPALLVCSQSNERTVQDNLDFFACSQRMSCLQPRFAIALFPLVVLKLLHECPTQNKPKTVLADTWIGDPTDRINGQLSRCFTALLEGSSKTDNPDTRAIGLCVDTLDILRRFTLHRFSTSSNHEKNRVKMNDAPGRNSRSPVDWLAELDDDPVVWRGVPWGVVIRIDGMLLAKACVQAKRFCSALFYAEMYADARFGGSTRDLKKLIGKSKDKADAPPSVSGDVSGFGGEIESAGNGHDPLADAIDLLGIMRDCYSWMADDQQRETVDRQLSDLRVAQGHNSFWVDDQPLRPSVRSLLQLDMQSSQPEYPPTGPGVVDWMQTVGLRAGLRTYIAGLTCGHSVLQNGGMEDKLRDRWFESCVLDPTLFTSNTFDQLSHLVAGPSSLPASAKPGFNENVFMGLMALERNDSPFCKLRTDSARRSILDQMSKLATQEVSVFSSADILDRLRALNDLDRIVSSRGHADDLIRYWRLDGSESDDYQAVVWDNHTRTPTGAIAPQYISESVREISLGAMFAVHGLTGDAHKGRDTVAQLLWKRASTSINIGRLDDAEATLNRLYALYRVNCDQSEVLKLRQLEATILERGGDFAGAIRRSTQVVDRLKREVKNDGLLANALTSCGRWMMKHRVDSGNVILEKFLRPGLDLALEVYEKDGTNQARNRLVHSYLALGDLAFKLLGLVSARIKSPEWSKTGRVLMERETEFAQGGEMLKKQKEGSKEWKQIDFHRREALKREIDNTRATREKVLASVNEYFTLALQTVTEALCSADVGVQNMSKYAYRMVALWFGCSEHGVQSDAVDGVIADAVERIPTYRFVPLAHQLLARLDERCTFNHSLVRLATRMCVDHPYHIIIHLVRIGGKDATTKDPKAKMAQEILTKVKADSPTLLAKLIESYEVLTEAYNELALANVDHLGRGEKKKIPFSSVCKKRLDQCLGKGSRRRSCPPCILTKTPVLRPGCDYGDGLSDPVDSEPERIIGFEDCFTVAVSGQSRPKIVICIGSKGNRYKQLVKGHDDCRGDAVMLQVFNYVNELMMMGGSSRGKEGNRALRVVTYSVVPLTPVTGVLEWVDNTLPLGDIIHDRNRQPGMHSRYFPGEWGNNLCDDVYDKTRGDQKQKREAFDVICSQYSPVLRFFFVERFGDSAESWYRAKMKYTQSVAVSSFVGHVLGIGDRHCNNILVHQRTGEVVNIDFGIVFEQGKTLRTPELVPFRLTRNIVDGFGPSGTEGAFTSVAEATMTTLRENSDSLLTILSAVTSDPLFKWRVTPWQARLRQRISDADSSSLAADSIEQQAGADQVPDNEAAGSAIRKVKEKLSGYEDGASGEQQSVVSQVQFLISAARDHDNLCELFHGWAPWV